MNTYISWELGERVHVPPLRPFHVLLPPTLRRPGTFLRMIPSRLCSMGNSSGLCEVGRLGEPSAACGTHRGAGQTLQTSEATVSLQSPLASLSRFSFVTSGALRALGTRHRDTGLVRPASASLPRAEEPQVPAAPWTCLSGTQHSMLRYSLAFPGLQLVLRVPWGLVHPVGRVGAASEHSQDRDAPGAWGGGGRVVESSLPTQPPSSTVAFTDSKILTASPRSPCLPTGPAGPGEPGGPGAPGAPKGPVSPRSPCQERGLRLRKERSGRGKERCDSDPSPARPMECPPGPTVLTLSETPILTLTPAAPSLPGGPSAPGLPCAKGNTPSELPTIPASASHPPSGGQVCALPSSQGFLNQPPPAYPPWAQLLVSVPSLSHHHPPITPGRLGSAHLSPPSPGLPSP